MRFAGRVGEISISGTMAVMQQALELRSRGIDVIDLGPGEPDFPTPTLVKQAGIDAITADFTRYTPGSGIAELREEVARKYSQEWGADFTAANVIITCGAKHAVFNVCMTVFEEGDEVLCPCPYWVTFPEIVKMTGARSVVVETREEDGFVLRASSVEKGVTPKTRGVIVNTPNNPTGAVVPQETVAELVKMARRQKLFLLFDETYEYFTYGNQRHTSLASLLNASDTDFALVGSCSKTYAMTGWRIGYCVGPSELIGKLDQMQSHQTGNPTSISQKAALTALRGGIEHFKGMKQEYERRRRLVLDTLADIPGFRCAPPFGAFYTFPNVTGAMSKLGIDTSQEFSQFLVRNARVSTVPGSAFGVEGYIRISYATSLHKLREGLARIREAVS